MEKSGCLVLCACGILLALAAIPCSDALNEVTCVNAEITDISPTSIEVGEEFTVGVLIENCGNAIPQFVSFELLNPPEDIAIKEPLVIEISSLYYGNSERFITYHMRADDDAIPGIHTISARLNYGEESAYETKEYLISLDIIGERAEMGIASVKSDPALPEKGDVVEMTIRVENSGKGDAKSVQVSLDHPFQGIKQAFIGTLEPGEDGPAIFTFIAEEDGDFEFPVTISYYDDFGKNEIETGIALGVARRNLNIGAIALAIILGAAIFAGIAYFFKVKRSKDAIIQQLLRGNGQKEKGRR